MTLLDESLVGVLGASPGVEGLYPGEPNCSAGEDRLVIPWGGGERRDVLLVEGERSASLLTKIWGVFWWMEDIGIKGRGRDGWI